jgi:hypothetical protein
MAAVDEDAAEGVSTEVRQPGEVAEWSKATVLKTVERKLRGFESLLLLLLDFIRDPSQARRSAQNVYVQVLTVGMHVSTTLKQLMAKM